ncbi:hypothetical protein [Delftia tsuruhatensis]|uniref:hypothetical protein n=1 Tax=Delftia tsuruhatensis TaxID=180282 RepID=UPI001F45CBC0|nr:hypothetical protein [Delftia tsuruhatensis]
MSIDHRENISGNAARVAKHRATHARLDVSVPAHISSTIDELAEMFGTSRAVVLRSMLRFALTNRDWKKLGLLWVGE